MVLRFTVMNSHFLKGMVMITWSPTYFGVEGVLTVGYTPISLLNLAPQSFTSFESTDTQFNAIIDYEQLQAVFRAAQDSDPIEFSQSFECDRIHKHGVLNARFNRPVNTGDSMNDIISMTIIDMRSEGMSPHLSLNTLVPMGIFDKDDFMAALRTSRTTVFIFEGRETEVMITTHRVISGINMGSNYGYHIVYSGTVAGAREAFVNGVPSVALSYDWVRGKSNDDDFTLAAEACIPIISTILADIKNKTYPKNCFLNITVPTDIPNHKGYQLTKQGTSLIRMGWKQVTSETQGGKMLSTMTMDLTPTQSTEPSVVSTQLENFLFTREVREMPVDNDGADHCSVQDGYITVTPINALFNVDVDCLTFFKQWLPSVSQ